MRNIPKLKQMYLDVFNRKSDYIPLAVKVSPSPSAILPTHTPWDIMHDPRKALESFCACEAESLKLDDSDWIPHIESNFIEALLPCVFGGTPEKAEEGRVDIRARFADTRKALEREIDDAALERNEYYQRALEHLRYLKEHAPAGIEVLPTRFFSPLDNAVLLRGGTFYEDLLAESELAERFMSKMLDVMITLTKRFKQELGMPEREQVTIRGVNFPGIRISWDSIVNLSPRLIRKFMFPHGEQFAQHFGHVQIHYCTGGAGNDGGYARSAHVIKTLAECPAFLAIDNWHGYKSAFNGDDALMLQDKIGICTDLSPEDVLHVDQFMQKPFWAQVPRKHGRAITASVTVESIEEGKRLYDIWRNYFEKTEAVR